jgi:ABC-type glycerol-3-phosphate transport system permease component
MTADPALPHRRSRPNRSIRLAQVSLSIAAALMLLPLVYQIGLSFKAPSEVFAQPLNPVPLNPTLENYAGVLERLPMGLYLFNSLVFSFSVSLGQLLLAIPAAYAFSYRRFTLERPLFALVLLSLMVPFVVTYIPNYLTVASLGLIGTLPGMILPLLGSGYAAFLLRQHFKTFPVSILEAARVDGATPLQELTHVLLPANRAALTSLGVYLFIQSWNQFIWPQLVGSRESAYTLTVAVQRFANGEGGTNWGSMMAAAVLATLPTVLMYLVVRRGVLTTFSEGAVKG